MVSDSETKSKNWIEYENIEKRVNELTAHFQQNQKEFEKISEIIDKIADKIKKNRQQIKNLQENLQDVLEVAEYQNETLEQTLTTLDQYSTITDEAFGLLEEYNTNWKGLQEATEKTLKDINEKANKAIKYLIDPF